MAFLIKSSTFAPLPQLAAALRSAPLLIDTLENYQKRSTRNKYRILGPNGIITLSVPLQKGKHQQQNIKEVKIDYSHNWPRMHRETIKSCYGSAAYFEHYADSLFALLESRPSHLFDFNLSTLDWLVGTQKSQLNWAASPEFALQEILPQWELKAYPQVFSAKFGFVANLSSLDLVMNLGPHSKSYLG